MSNVEEDFEDEGQEQARPQKSAAQEQDEAYARTIGWIAEEDWDEERAAKEGTRKPYRFMTAREYIDKTESSMPMMRDRLRHQEGMIRDISSKLDDALNVLVEQRNGNKLAVARAFKRGKEVAAQEMQDAVAEGDLDKHKKAKDTYDKLVAKEAEVAEATKIEQPQRRETREEEPEQPPLDPTTDAWVKENASWFYDPTLNQLMIIEHTDLRARKPGQGMRASLEEAAENLRRRYPEKFGQNTRRASKGAVMPSSGAQPRGGARSFESIPKEDQDAYYRQAKQLKARGVDFTKQEYMDEYAFS